MSRPGGPTDDDEQPAPLGPEDRAALLAALNDDERAEMVAAVKAMLTAPDANLTADQIREIDAAVQAKHDAERASSGALANTTPAQARHMAISRRLREAYDLLSLPVAILFLLHHRGFHPSYGLTWRRRIQLGVKMFRNTRNIQTGTSYKAHLAMAAKLFEIPPSVKGAVVECGCWKGGSTANLSLICDIIGRDLLVYDSFSGLPPAPANDKYAWSEAEGSFRGDLEIVRDHVTRFGAIERCTFRKGFFSDTLPHHVEPIVFAFLDVDYASSLHDCVLNLWPHLTERGYIFIDEYVRIDYCALFFSEKWWSTYFDRPPPGMMGVGTGIGVGQYYLGPMKGHPWIQSPSSVAYTRKDFYGLWDYDPSNPDEVEKARGW